MSPCASACSWRSWTSRSWRARSHVIQHALAIPDDRISWIQTGYLIAEVIAIPLTGMLTRALSLRWLFVGRDHGLHALQYRMRGGDRRRHAAGHPRHPGFLRRHADPAVFTSVFTILPKKHEILATTMAGVFAMIAPTVGPYVGGLADGILFLALDIPDQH
ncbi:MAG: hypothetical protein WDM89_19600, partial [Rhizomicrobium sp.]